MRVLYKRLGFMELGYVTDVGCALKCGEAPLNYSVLLLVNRFAERPSSVVSLQYPTLPHTVCMERPSRSPISEYEIRATTEAHDELQWIYPLTLVVALPVCTLQQARSLANCRILYTRWCQLGDAVFVHIRKMEDEEG
jgi:hypothetical protein